MATGARQGSRSGCASPTGQRIARRWRRRSHLSVIAVLVPVLAACGGTGGGGDRGVDPTSNVPSAASTAAQVTSTGATEANPATPTISDGLVIGTVASNEPITKAAPTGPAATEAAMQMPAGSANFDADGDGWYTFPEFEAAVAALYPSYVWPDNYHIDPATLLVEDPAETARGDRYQAGGEYTIVGGAHMCAWELAWLDGYRNSDDDLMGEAIDQLRTVALSNPMMDISMRDHVEDVIQRAVLGDPALVQQDVDVSCRGFGFFPATPAATP